MKKFTNITLALFAIFFSVVAADAQNTTGSVTISGEVTRKVDLKVNNSTLNFGDVSTGESTDTSNLTITQGFKVKTVELEVRSNTPYEVKLTVDSPNMPGVAEGGSEMGLNDIGFTVGDSTFGATSLPSASQSGAFNMNDPAFYYANNADKAGKIADGRATYAKTLANVSAGQQIYRGSAVSNQGNASTSDNWVKTQMHFLIAPEYYAPSTGFSATVNMDVVALPSLN